MKTNSSLTLSGLCALSLCYSAQAEVEKDIELGFEAVTGYRSEYTYRGFQLANSTIDFQIESEIALNNHTFLNIGARYATETGNGNFDEAAFFAYLHFKKSDQWTVGLSATYQSYGNYTPTSALMPVFQDGTDIGAFATWSASRDFSATIGAYYDTGADGWYGHLETQWSKVLSDDAFIALKTGVSFVDNYYGRDGSNDAYARLSLTYHVSETVSITPFIGGSVLLDDSDPGDDSAYGGVWFEVRF
ncbi:MAG: hypothetical protein ACPG32_13345 [Akkermansiaceae bacterium]